MGQNASSVLMQCRHFFGLKPGQDLQAFKAELDALSLEDRQVLAAWFNAAGMPTEMPAAPQESGHEATVSA